MTEFGLIEQIKSLFTDIEPHGFEGIGDDCAVLEMGGEALAFTSDMLIEDVHFLRRATSAYDLGYKSLAVNLSDVAAMGLRPAASMLSVAIPKELTGDYIEEFMRGYHALSQKYNVPLIGGDTTASKGPFSINITAIGRGAVQNIKRRADAKVGDVVLVNGSLGESGAGLKDLFNGDFESPLAKIHRLPEPQVVEGEWLGARSEVHAMMDISDGIASDLHHILKLSDVGASIEIESVPTSVDIVSALSAGEDYKLLLTASAQECEALQRDYLAAFGSPLYAIGVIEEQSGLRWLKSGVEQPLDIMGFRHY